MSNDSRDTEERTWSWKNGDPVTHKVTGDTGLVKWTNRRQSDGKRFLRVRLTSGPKANTECWGNDEFILGVGAKRATCADCGFGYRTDEEHPTFCPCCARQHRPNYDASAVSIAHARNRLRGTATTSDPAPADAPVYVRDDPFAGTPFLWLLPFVLTLWN